MKIERLKGESMTKKRLWLTVALSALIAPAVIHAQDAQPEYGIKFGGFVKFDAFNDTGAVTAARDDMFLLYPAARSQITSVPNGIADPTTQALYVFGNNEDLNAVGQTGMTAVQSRLSGKITGPDAFGAKVSGLIELDFFGSANYNANMTRLRHAWVNLDWGKVAFRAGQDWHPLFLQGGVFPGTLQFNPLAPIHPFGRAPQMAFTFKPVEGLRLSLYALEQSYHADTDRQSTLITGQPSGRALRNAKRPELAIQGDYTVSGFTIGGTYDNKIIIPLDATNATIAADCDASGATTTCPPTLVGNNRAEVRTQIYSAYMQFKTGDLKIKASTTWGDNWFALLGTGGYAMKETIVEANLQALGVPAADVTAYQQLTKRQYSQTRSQAYWAEIAYGKDVEFGIVGGRTINKGAADEVKTSIPAVGRNATDLKEVVTIAPRIKFTSGKTMIGLEYIYSAAKYKEDDKNYRATLNYATTGNYAIPATVDTLAIGGLTINNDSVINKNGEIGKTYTVANHRIQFSVQQNF
jgi:hypothetical protein